MHTEDRAGRRFEACRGVGRGDADIVVGAGILDLKSTKPGHELARQQNGTAFGNAATAGLVDLPNLLPATYREGAGVQQPQCPDSSGFRVQQM